MQVPIFIRDCAHLRKEAVAFEMSCVYSVVYVMLRCEVLLLTGDCHTLTVHLLKMELITVCSNIRLIV